MRDNSKFLVGVLAGAAAGAAVVLLLGTESGKQMLAELKGAATKALRDWASPAEDVAEEVKKVV